MIEAIDYGDLKTFQHLLQDVVKEGKINSSFSNGYVESPLLNWAITARCEVSKRTDMIKLLLNSKADPNLRINKERYLMHATGLWCCRNEAEITMAKTFASGSNGIKVDLDKTDCHDLTPLQISADFGALTSCRVLLECKASVNAQNSFGETALSVSSLRGKVETTQLLLESKADVNVKLGRKSLMEGLEFAQTIRHFDTRAKCIDLIRHFKA